jgi:hypothetical protein
MVGPDLQSSRAEDRLYILQQKFVLKNPARKHDGINVFLRANRFQAVTQPVRDTELKCPRDFGNIAAASAIQDQGMQQRTKVQLA